MHDLALLPRQLADSTGQLLKTLVDFPTERFNNPPVAGGWSAGEVAEHLLLLEGAANRLLPGPAQPPTPERLEKVTHIHGTFLNLTTRLTAHGPIVPMPGAKDKRLLLQHLAASRQTLTELLPGLDLNQVALSFSHPLFGELTRAEWVYFVMYHGERHLYQLKRLMAG